MVVRFFTYIWIRLNFYVNNTENVGQTLNSEVLAEVNRFGSIRVEMGNTDVELRMKEMKESRKDHEKCCSD